MWINRAPAGFLVRKAPYERVWRGLEFLALDEREAMKLIDAIRGECYE
ncbi:hypothetical protein Jiend_20430 [Micromonospora endophytica]|nr:hypothetical protein Jiend_20430 [Micromonospora endophytica]